MPTFMENAREAFEHGRFIEALAHCNEQILDKPNYIDAYVLAARCYIKLKRPLDSITQSEKILTLDPEYAIAHAMKAEAYYDLNDFAKSKEEASLAYEMDPENSQILALQGSILGLENRLDDAAALLEKAVQKNPNDYIAYFNLSLIYRKKYNWRRVFFSTKEMLRMRPTLKNLVRVVFSFLNYSRLNIVLLFGYSILLFILMLYGKFISVILVGSVVPLLLILIIYYLRSE